MNITDLIFTPENITVNTRFCQVLEVSLNYNLYVMINFVYFIIMFVEMKRGYLEALENENGFPIRKTMFIAMVIFNVCMLLFQFLLLPLTTMAGG